MTVLRDMWQALKPGPGCPAWFPEVSTSDQRLGMLGFLHLVGTSESGIYRRGLYFFTQHKALYDLLKPYEAVVQPLHAQDDSLMTE